MRDQVSASLGILLLSIAALSGCDRSDLTDSATSATADAAAKPMTDAELRDRLDRVVDFTVNQRHMNTKDHAAWQVVHGALAYGRDLTIEHEGKLVPALDYLLAGGRLNGWNLRKAEHGVSSVLESGSKTGMGHEDQWLGYLSQAGLKPEERLVVAGQDYTINDLITQAQWNIHEGMEATWTLMAFSVYLPLDAEWTAKDGTKWTVERIVGMETSQDLGESSCGGTHRLYALTKAVNRKRKESGELTGEWLRADEKINDCMNKVKLHQQPDGSFSTNFFTRPATSADLSLRLHSTGHTLEVLDVALTDEQFKEPWVERAVVNLLHLFEMTQNFPLECGALYHGARGLKLYRERRFGPREVASAQSATPVNSPAAESPTPPAKEPGATDGAQ
jgi:hypothetical protein